MAEEEEESEEEILEKYQKAGKILAEVREGIRPLVKVDTSILEICEKAEKLILEKEAKPAFPCNVSINNYAAHYTASAGEETLIQEKDVVKVDIGVHVDGYIGDGAFTVSFDPEYDSLVEAAEESLRRGLEIIKPGVKNNEVGKIIEQTTKEINPSFSPIKELSGHKLEKYTLHGVKIIPNISVPHGQKIEEGEIYALETFATDGTGSVHDTPLCYIYRLQPVRIPVRSKGARKILKIVAEEYKTLPFAERWLTGKVSSLNLKFGLRELINSGLLYEYHVLADKKGSKVAQAEETFIVTEDGCEIITIL